MSRGTKTNWMAKMPMELKRELDRIRLQRIKEDRDSKMISYKRLGLAISRHKKLLDDLRIAELKEGDLS